MFCYQKAELTAHARVIIARPSLLFTRVAELNCVQLRCHTHISVQDSSGPLERLHLLIQCCCFGGGFQGFVGFLANLRLHNQTQANPLCHSSSSATNKHTGCSVSRSRGEEAPCLHQTGPTTLWLNYSLETKQNLELQVWSSWWSLFRSQGVTKRQVEDESAGQSIVSFNAGRHPRTRQSRRGGSDSPDR